jgi:hypothetical protein
MAVMESAWKRAKRALGLSFRGHPPHISTMDDVGDIFSDVRLSDASLSAASSDSGYRALIPTTPTPTSSGLRISKSKAKSSKVKCFSLFVIYMYFLMTYFYARLAFFV